jgi:hypothetical protein
LRLLMESLCAEAVPIAVASTIAAVSAPRSILVCVRIWCFPLKLWEASLVGRLSRAMAARAPGGQPRLTRRPCTCAQRSSAVWNGVSGIPPVVAVRLTEGRACQRDLRAALGGAGPLDASFRACRGLADGDMTRETAKA